MAGVKGGQDVHLLRGQTGYTTLTAPEASENASEGGERPHVPLPRRVEVDALAPSLLLGGGVLGVQGVEIVGCDGFGRWHGRGLHVTSRFALIPLAAAQVDARG